MEDPSSVIGTASWITAGAIILLLFMSGFFSGSETALTAASRGKLRSQADKGSAGAERALEITEDSERLIGSVLLGNNLVNILATALATSLFTALFGESGVAFATLVMTLLVLIFAEVLPKTYAITNAESAAAMVSAPIKVVVTIFAPVVNVVRALVRQLLRLFGVETDPDTHILSVHEEIAGALELGRQEGVVQKEQRDRLLGALDLHDRDVEEIMLHRSEIEVINVDDSPEAIVEQSLKSSYTRLPVFRDDPENIVGVLHAKDLLRAVDKALRKPDGLTGNLDSFDVTQVMREPYFVPETTTLEEQMRQFLAQSTHFALVVDEYGGLQGLITLEDILEEIVGEITDEFDLEDEQRPEAGADGNYDIEGAMTIRDLNRQLDWNLPDEEANTVAGLVIHEAQSIPLEGQVFSFHGYRFEVTGKSENRITNLKVRPL
ncbi:MAG: HlyC/CorC family transporter [Litoreibacter sp.]|nr:HlyC/CorC family transporter [Litoreibacter sp.]